MADKKVSQETDLGLAGIDGTVEYRVIKSGGTYKQKYSDLFSYINSHVTIPSLQQVLDYNHDLTPDNFFAGTLAGAGITSNHNIGIGEYAGYNNNGSSTVSLGFAAGATNTNIIQAISIGVNSLNSSSQGSGPGAPIAIGSSAFANSTVAGGVAIGSGAGILSDLVDSIAIGTSSLQYRQGSYNVAIGYQAAYISGSLQNMTNTVAIGSNAAFALVSSDNNVAIGSDSLYNAEVDSKVIGIGPSALKNSLTAGGSNIISIGANSMYEATSGGDPISGIVAIGDSALYSHRTDSTSNVVAVGTSAASNSGNITESVAIGSNALSSLAGDKESYYNIVAIGNGAAQGIVDALQIGLGNLVAIGYNAAYQNQGSNDVIAIGNNAAYQNVYSNVVAIGLGALNSALAGEIVAIGTNAFASAAIGVDSTNNIGIGNLAGANSGGVNNIFIGLNAGESSQQGTIIAIGETAAQSNTGRSVTAIGLNAGAGNPIDNQFILSNDTFPKYDDDVTAIAYYSTQGLPAGNSYLYYDELNNVVRAYRT